jgi:hypothetical protein
MMRSQLRLARPIYEGLPWLYMACGLGGLVASYFESSPLMSVVFGLPGLAALLGGIVILLRRRDYRRMRAQYLRPDALAEQPMREAERN